MWHISVVSREKGKEGNVLFMIYSTHLKEGKNEVFYFTMHSTHFIYGYMVSDIWLRTIQIVREEIPLPPHVLLFPISIKGYFICTIPQRG